MYAFELSLQYRKAVRDRDFEAILSMFSSDAVIVTPLKGICDVKTYHEWLFATVKKTTVKIVNAYQALNGEISIAVQAKYEWVIQDDKVIHFIGMSVFEFTPDKKKIQKLSSFYDTSLVRPQIVDLGSR